MNIGAFIIALLSPISSEDFVKIKDKVVFCSVMRTERKMSDYTEGKTFVYYDRIIVSSMYRNLAPLSFEYKGISEYKLKEEEYKITIEFRYKKQLVIMETYIYKN